jgi:hypothetical protein
MGSTVGVTQLGNLYLRGQHPRCEIARAMPQAFSRRFLDRAEMLKNRVVTVR